MVKDRSIFESRFLRKLRRNEDRILDFLEKENIGYCDDCLSVKLRIFPRQQVNQICRRLRVRGILIREKGLCLMCRKYKILNFHVKVLRRIEKMPQAPSEEKAPILEEEQIREIISEFLGIPLSKEKLSIFGKEKEFDLVNIEARVVGDIKFYRYSGATPSAEFSIICEYVWLMEKLEESSSSKWRKIIVGSGNRETFEKYAKNFHPWLGNVEIYFVDNKSKVQKIRDAVKLYAHS